MSKKNRNINRKTRKASTKTPAVLQSMGVFFKHGDKGYEFQFVQENSMFCDPNLDGPTQLPIADLPAFAHQMVVTAQQIVHGHKTAGYSLSQMLDLLEEAAIDMSVANDGTMRKWSGMDVTKMTICVIILETFGRIKSDNWNGISYAAVGTSASDGGFHAKMIEWE